MNVQTLYQTFKRYRSLQTHRISAMPIAILMPHSACNCRCVMCDIWKGNARVQQLSIADISGMITSLKQLGTRQVVLSGGEALLNIDFFKLCEILKTENFKVTLLSTGISFKKHALPLTEWVDEIIVSLDGDAETHDAIRNIPGAFMKMAEGIELIRMIRPEFKISGRTVIHKLNFRKWPQIIDTARDIGLQQISFLPADVSTHAFNRHNLWDEGRQHELLLNREELAGMSHIIDDMISSYRSEFDEYFIAESPEKIKKIYQYYAAFHGLNEFPFKKCNAPWVSTVVEPDGNVRPCFFHEPYGNISEGALQEIVNSDKAIGFRRSLDVQMNPICQKCVCYLNLPPGMKV